MNSAKNRKDVEKKYIWSTEDILNEQDIPSILDNVQQDINEISKYEKQLSKDNIFDCLDFIDNISLRLERVYFYAHLKSDEDKSITKYLELSDKVMNIYVSLSSAAAFVDPIVSKFKMSDLILLRDNKEHSEHSLFFDNIIRAKKHILSKKEEELLSNTMSFSDGFDNAFTMFDAIDVDLGKININGEELKMTHGLYSNCMINPNREIRKQAYNNMYFGFKNMIHTVAAIYIGNVKLDCFYSKVRKYKSCLDKALFNEKIPIKVYNNLIKSVDDNLKYLHKYVAYKKKYLKLDQMYMYDMYVPLAKDVFGFIDFEKAFDICVEALKPLGEEYLEVFKSAKEQRWMDVEETVNKKTGAYMSDYYGLHPYVLLNHKGKIGDVFTIAHEMGHAMHSYYSNGNQPYQKAQYPIFLAEIASTCNEVLLIKHLLKTAVGEERRYLLTYYLEMFRTTLFRQTMFAEFEKFTHESIENDLPLTYENLSEYYGKLNEKYYGSSVITDELISYEWARIPHFYSAFYVYKYATGITCAVNIANMILNDSSSVNKYKEFLKSGCSRTPMETLALVDIDLTTKRPYSVAMSEFKNILEELKKLR